MANPSTHGNVMDAHHFRKVDGRWQRRLHGARNIESNWHKLCIEHTDTEPRQDKTGRVWKLPISNIWTWK
jgi:hypothetical protein